MKARNRFGSARWALAALSAVALLWSPFAARAADRGAAFANADLTGTGATTMQLETVPARVSRVAVRPGSDGAEAWAIGTSTAKLPGWSTGSVGQVVFLKYTSAEGWRLVGPPLERNGAVAHPALSSFAIAPSGEGWAVGDAGAILHKAPGSDVWRVSDQSRVVSQTLGSVSLATDGSGFAVGEGPTILRLHDGLWTQEAATADMTAASNSLQSVATVSSNEAWAITTGQVTGVDSTSLAIFHRTAAGWQQVKTGQPIFDSPPAKSPDGELNRGAEAGSVAADASGAWIGGMMHPRSSTFPDGDPTPGDASRAFVLHYDARTSAFTSYCPDQYGERNGDVDLTKMCDEPFPEAPYHVASLAIVPGGEVFAGGLGLFHFKNGGWFREPDANGYLISIAFAAATDGFVASPGRSLGAGGLIRSSTTTIGHFTASPRHAATGRWALPQTEMLYAVAPDGNGSGRYVAVGNEGAGAVFSGDAWDSLDAGISGALHDVAWPPGDTPWAVGQAGYIMHLAGSEWDYVQPQATDSSLYSIAFRSRDDGLAVGLGGVIVSFHDGAWHDVTSSLVKKDLYKVIATDEGYIVVGRDGTVIEGNPGEWRVRDDVRAMLTDPDQTTIPTLYAATRFGDSIVIGGQDSALIVRDARGHYRRFDAPLQGTVLALGAAGDALYASVSPDEEKWRGEQPAAQRGTVMRYVDGAWSDVGLGRHSTLLRDKVDPAEFEDPIYDLAITTETGGWGIGGSPADIKNSADGQSRVSATAAVYKISYGSDPEQPASEAPLDSPHPGVPFATFGESWCGTGLCSSAAGTGTMADEVSLAIRDEINRASDQPGGPRFVLFTGSMRASGIPEELAQFKRYLAGFKIPVFAALGSQDRFTSSSNGSPLGSGATGSSDYWKQVFSSQPTPWGQGPALSSFRPVADTTPGLGGMARTHYAFDYLHGGVAKLRVVVIDSSTRSYGTAQDQNPPEDQGPWLKTTIEQATNTMHIPTIVAMNQPTILPSDQQFSNWTAVQNQQDFETTVAVTGTTAVITGGPRVNAIDTIKGTVPLYVVGGGGAPLGRDTTATTSAVEPPSKLPTDGYYHAWHLMTVAPSNAFLGRGKIVDQAFPVLESLAMHSSNGALIRAGDTTDMTAVARDLNGGFSDPEQAKAAYVTYGRSLFRCGYKAQGNGYCVSNAAVMPRARFYSEDPATADFVQRDPANPYQPKKIGGVLYRDPDGVEGMLCVFKLGKVGIDAIVGMHRTRMVVTGIPGNGRCIDAAVLGKVIPLPRTPEPARKPFPEEPELFHFTRPVQEVAVVFPPPPAPVVAPAPPGAPGVGKKEEHEFEVETEGHGDHSFLALEHSRERRGSAALPAGVMLGTIVAMAAFGAVGAATVRERRQHKWSFVIQRRTR